MKPSRVRAGSLVVLIDDDPMVLEATGGLFRRWGCRVVAAETYEQAMASLADLGRPDLIVCDYRLSQGSTGVDAIQNLRNAFEIPALLISGDASSPANENRPGGYHLLYKPVQADAFRAALADASRLQR